MSEFINRIASQLNLRWAWEKVRRQASPGDVWFDELELAGFELELERQLRSIASEFQKGTFRLKPLRPLPYPKQKDKSGNARVRQMFYVTVRDQVAWTALVNVIGPYVDSKMPPWSYGNRLFRTIWIEEGPNGIKHRMVGSYRHASGRLYLPFGQSWPIFRRHVYLTTLAMTGDENGPTTLDERTEEEQRLQALLGEENRCPFVIPGYWQDRRPTGRIEALYWCSLDLKSFYPSVNRNVVRSNIVDNLPEDWKKEANDLLGSMLDFRLDTSGWESSELKLMVGRNRLSFAHIPTGLYVAGFLANAGLLRVDLEVSRRLEQRRVAHLRFVDDHIVLAYSFEELLSWVKEYVKILRDLDTGARINIEKVQPAALGTLLGNQKKAKKSDASNPLWKRAKEACSLDPRFPSPLMTKTLALVSAIARTDFNLLELSELGAVADQLEHLLLVDIPDEEIPHKTRMSFAATRLIRLVEARLACSTPKSELRLKRETLQSELPIVDPPKPETEGDSRSEVRRVFHLLRKVIRERPDSVRLWTRALQMCRSLGACGISDLVKDLHRVQESGECNPLATEYLSAIILALAGTQAIAAANIVRDVDSAQWRRRAAQEYLEKDLTAASALKPGEGARWFLRTSWLQYCVGIYCADVVLKDEKTPRRVLSSVSLPIDELEVGRKCVESDSSDFSPALWAWWATRGSLLRDPGPNANELARTLGGGLSPSRETAAFWRMFPSDVPPPILASMLLDQDTRHHLETRAGWWYDALRDRPNLISSLSARERNAIPSSVRRLLTRKHQKTISLYDWCAGLREKPSSDPRSGEWTALEIVSQVASLLATKPTFGPAYIREARKMQRDLPHVHPANFRVPLEWMQWSKVGEMEPSWDEWRSLVFNKRITYVAHGERVQDRRYTPLEHLSLLFELNPVRGIGLLLYGLLQKTFDLPTIWNGSGQAEVLSRLPRLILEDLACSSWTLGILEGCLWPRATENLFQKRYPQTGYNAADDTTRDPVQFENVEAVWRAVEVSKNNLRKFQLSTLGDRARQLTPISIRQLTRPDWRKVFDSQEEEGESVHG